MCSVQVYMYAAWHGWVIPMFLFLALLRLSLNYLIARSVQAQPPLSHQKLVLKEQFTLK